MNGDTTSTADLSLKMRRLYEEKTKQREAARQYYRKYIENPFRSPSDLGPFDAAHQRYSAMRIYHYEYIKPCAKSYFRLLYIIVPICVLHFVTQRDRKQKEKLLRSGQVAYADRDFKYA